MKKAFKYLVQSLEISLLVEIMVFLTQIKDKLNHFWINVSQLGVSPDLDFAEQKKIRLLNQIVVVMLLMLSTMMIQSIGDFNARRLGANGIVCINLFTLLWFHHKGWFKLARFFFIIANTIIVFVVYLLFGPDIELEALHFVGIMVIILFFDDSKTQWILIVMTLIIYLLNQWLLLTVEPIMAQDMAIFTPYFIFITSALCVTIISKLLIEQNRQFEKQTTDLLDSLRAKNEHLMLIQNQIEQQNNQLAAANEELRSSQEKVEEQNTQLATANKELERFAYIASHDLKTPLRGIHSFLNLIERKIGDDANQDIKDYIKFATGSAQQMYQLVQDIRDFAELNQLKIFRKTLDLNTLLQKVRLQLHQHLIETKAVVNSVVLPSVFANESQMMLVFQNLIENGIKYNESDVPVVNISFEDKGESITLKFQDNGIGIAAEFHHQIFEMFKRLHTQEIYAGSGLGLAICYKIVQQNNGKMWVTSEPGSGSVFFVNLPKNETMSN